MAIEKRDPKSHAKLFIPTKSERNIRAKHERLNKEIKEVQELKYELQDMIKDLKNTN